MRHKKVVVVGAGINGLVAANYLARAGCDVTVIEKADHVGGACVSAMAEVGGVQQNYALGASVLGLMQDYVFRETGLKDRLKTFVPTHPKAIFFPGDTAPTWIYRDPADLDRELADKWGERGKVEAFRADESRVVDYLQRGYRDGIAPSLADARAVLGQTLTKLWISGSAKDLLDHYLTSERAKMYMAMTVTESGPVSLSDPYSAFTLPMMDSGSIFDGYYGFVEGGIWRITEELGRLNTEAGIITHLSSTIADIDTGAGKVHFETGGVDHTVEYDQLVLATDPVTASKLVGTKAEVATTGKLKFRGSSGKLNLMFKNPVRWKHRTDAGDNDTAFRFLFSVNSIEEFEQATLKVLDDDVDYEPGYMQIYCEGGAMRQLNYREPFDRLAIFFKNFSLGKGGEALPEVEQQAKETVLSYIENPEDCVWSRLLTPKNLQETFHFPGGNLDHTLLTGGQTFADRTHSTDPATGFYTYGGHSNVYMCAAGSYPCGSVAGTPGYMCSQQMLRTMPNGKPLVSR
jgi:phytoene dehydrogenase-like protein